MGECFVLRFLSNDQSKSVKRYPFDKVIKVQVLFLSFVYLFAHFSCLQVFAVTLCFSRRQEGEDASK